MKIVKNCHLNYIILILLIAIGIISYNINELWNKQSYEGSLGIEKGGERHPQLLPLYTVEEEATIKFFKHYQVIKHLYESVLVNNISNDEFKRGIFDISRAINTNYSEYEDFRLNFRYEVDKRVLNDREFNQLYYWSFELRNSLFSFVNAITKNEALSKHALIDVYTYEITNRFEKHLLLLVNLLQTSEEDININLVKTLGVDESSKKVDLSKIGDIKLELSNINRRFTFYIDSKSI